MGMIANIIGQSQIWPMGCLWNPISSMASTILINDDTDKVAFLVSMPKTGTLKKIAFCTGTVTTGDATFSCRIEAIGTDGNPDGNLAYLNASGTANIADGDDNTIKESNINSTTGVAVVQGDNVFAVFNRTAAGSGNLNLRYILSPGGLFALMRDYNITSGSAWTKTLAHPSIAVNIDDIWHLSIGGLIAQNIISNETFATPKERGIGIYPVSDMKISGCWIYGIFPAASTVKFILYETPLVAPTAIATTNAIDTDLSNSAAANRLLPVQFTTTVIIKKNYLYVLAIAPQGAENFSIAYNNIINTYINASANGTYGIYYARDTVGATTFTATNTRMPYMGLVVNGTEKEVLGPFSHGAWR
jgi:hypothetical protein